MGLAAGLGIAALASYFGFGEALTMFLTVLLIGMVLMVIAGFVLRRLRGGAPSRPMAAPAEGRQWRVQPTRTNVPVKASRPCDWRERRLSQPAARRPGFGNGSVSAEVRRRSVAPWGIPAGFDTGAF